MEYAVRTASKNLGVPEKAFSSKNETLKIMKSLRPIEKFVDFPVDPLVAPINKITVNDREVYRRYIGPEFAEVSKIIGTEWRALTEAITAPAGGMGMGGMGMGVMVWVWVGRVASEVKVVVNGAWWLRR